MSVTNKWPDFRLASTLRSFLGSQSDEATQQSKFGRQPNQKEDGHQLEPTVTDRSNNPHHDEASAAMADVDAESIAGSVASAASADADELPGADEDFGAIEMFDSNSAPAMFSSQAPVAFMSEDVPLDSSSKKSKRDRKTKRDKKGKSSQEDATSAQSAIPAEEDSSKKQKRPKKKSTANTGAPDGQINENESAEPSSDTPWGQLQQEEEAAASAHTKRKRNPSDSTDRKGRKKHRTHHRSSEGQSDKEPTSSAFLQKSKDKRGALESAIYEDNEPESDTQKSPTVAHLRRRSQSREARSRENSIPIENRADVDMGTEERAQIDAVPVADAEGDVERLAREAWNEHRNGQQAVETGHDGGQDTTMTDQYPQEPLNATLDEGAEAEPSSEKHKKGRSTRKKAKPTYFEQEPVPDIASDEEGNRNAMEELPSPSAGTPNARRARRAAKKQSRGRKPKREKLSQSMRGGSENAEDDSGRAPTTSQSRLNGFTQGRFTDAELARIARAVETYRAANDLTQLQVNELIHAPGGTTAGETHAQLWSGIFAECPDRHRQKVINITRKKFHNFVARGTWTPEQDAELTELIQQHGTKWSYIAGIVNRHPEDLRDRYRNYIVCGQNQRRDVWTEEEEARLTQYIIESMMVIDELRANQPSRALLQKSYEELIDWQNISELMDRTRSRLQCITKWKSLNIRTHGKDHLISNEPDSQISFRLEKARRQIAAMPVEERYRFVMAVNRTAIGTSPRIIWQRLVDKSFRSQWHRYTQMLLWRRLQQTVPNWETYCVRDCAQYLVDQYDQTGDLPDVSDGNYNDTDEMQYMQSIAPVASMLEAEGDERGGLTTEFVTGSDGEDDLEKANGEAELLEEGEEQEAPQDVEMSIDPALVELAQSSKKSASTQQATEKPKTPASRKRGRKAAPAFEDPIEDASQGLQQAQTQESEIDVEQFRKKKTPSKFKSPQVKKDAKHSSPVPDNDDDSAMDDMEDLPARVAVA